MKKLFKNKEDKWILAGFFAGSLSKQMEDSAEKIGINRVIEITPEMILNCIDAYEKQFKIGD